VLGACHAHLADEAGAAGHAEPFHRARVRVIAHGTRLRCCPMVNLTRIYTRTGDDGTTSLGDLSRTSKTDPRLMAFADVDEANSSIGVALALGGLPPDIADVLRMVQNDLFDVGADLCTPVVP